MSGREGSGHDAPVRVARRVTLNTLATAVANIANKVLMFAFYIVVARHLGVKLYGTLQAGVAFVTMFSVLTDMGLGNITAREVARDRSVARNFVANSLGVILVVTVLVVGLIIGLVNLLRYPESVRRVVYILCVMLACGAFVSFFAYVFLGYERMYFSAATQMLQTAVLVAGAFALARLGRVTSPEYFALAYVGAAAVAMVLSAALAGRLTGGLSVRFDLPEWRRLIGLSLPVGIAVILVSLYYWNGHTLLQKWHGEESVGLFNAAFRLVVGACFAGQALSSALYPLLSRFHVVDRERLAGVFGSGLRFVAMLATPVAVLTIPLARPMVSLVYGAKYQGSAVILQVLVWWGAIAVFSSLLSNFLLAVNRTKTVTLQCLLSLLVNLAANFLLIPKLVGKGAAIALVAAETAGVVFLTVVLLRSESVIRLRGLVRFFPRVLVALVPAVAVAVWLSRYQTPAGDVGAILGSAALYLVMLPVTGAMGRQELRTLWSMLRTNVEQ